MFLHWVFSKECRWYKKNNPSDIIIELDDGTYTGYSNKISVGKDATPKLNTGIWSAYQKLGDRTQISGIAENMIDKAWNDASSKITMKSKNAYQALKDLIFLERDLVKLPHKQSLFYKKTLIKTD